MNQRTHLVLQGAVQARWARYRNVVLHAASDLLQRHGVALDGLDHGMHGQHGRVLLVQRPHLHRHVHARPELRRHGDAHVGQGVGAAIRGGEGPEARAESVVARLGSLVVRLQVV